MWSASPHAGQDPASMPCRALAPRRASEAGADLALGPAPPLGRKPWKQRSRLARSAPTAEVRGSNPLSSTRKSPRTALGSRRRQSLGSTDGLKLAHCVRGRWPPVKIMVTSGLTRRARLRCGARRRRLRSSLSSKGRSFRVRKMPIGAQPIGSDLPSAEPIARRFKERDSRGQDDEGN